MFATKRLVKYSGIFGSQAVKLSDRQVTDICLQAEIQFFAQRDEHLGNSTLMQSDWTQSGAWTGGQPIHQLGGQCRYLCQSERHTGALIREYHPHSVSPVTFLQTQARQNRHSSLTGNSRRPQRKNGSFNNRFVFL